MNAKLKILPRKLENSLFALFSLYLLMLKLELLNYVSYIHI